RALAAGRDRRQLGRSALSAAGSSRGRGAGAGDLRLAQGPVAALRAGASPLTDTAALRSKVTILVTRHPGGGSTEVTVCTRFPSLAQPLLLSGCGESDDHREARRTRLFVRP